MTQITSEITSEIKKHIPIGLLEVAFYFTATLLRHYDFSNQKRFNTGFCLVIKFMVSKTLTNNLVVL